ncbi:transposase, partial [Nonomuraea sp. KM90]|uniref:transposase n=1 Tax=Nonomuraea sp. KM90 TaxID=3457428 RepID=UPI003FCC3AF7
MLLHKLADRVGLTEALGRLWPHRQSAAWRDRAHVLVALAAAIACGARSLLEAERLQAHQAALFGAVPSVSTTHRALAGLDEAMLARIAKMRAQVRRRLWRLLHLRPGGFPWLTVAGKRLRGWIVIDIDATIITATSDKHGAAVTFKKTYGFHPLACWCANTQEALAMLLRPGNAGSNTVPEHLRMLTDALAQ